MSRRSGAAGRSLRVARALHILSVVMAEPGLGPAPLSSRFTISERTLFRDLAQLRRLGYFVTHHDGYRLEDRLELEGRESVTTVDQELRQLLSRLGRDLPPDLLGTVEQDVVVLVPSAVAELVALALERRAVSPS